MEPMEPMERWESGEMTALAGTVTSRERHRWPGRQPGTVTLTLACLLLVGALALLYLGQVSAVAAASARWQTLQVEQTRLLRQDQEQQQRLATAQSPAYIVGRARALGMVLVPPGAISIVAAPTPNGTPSGATGGQP